jgi:hypothetical protein
MRERRALVEDVHELASRMPHVAVEHGPQGNSVYQVGGKSFVFFRTPRPDAVDPGTGERYPDVIVFWVPSEVDKQALVQDPDSPFFTTPHFDGHPSVLVRASRVGELTLTELTEVIQDAWLSRASPSRAKAWLTAQPGHPRALSGGLRQAREEARLLGQLASSGITFRRTGRCWNGHRPRQRSSRSRNRDRGRRSAQAAR